MTTSKPQHQLPVENMQSGRCCVELQFWVFTSNASFLLPQHRKICVGHQNSKHCGADYGFPKCRQHCVYDTVVVRTSLSPAIRCNSAACELNSMLSPNSIGEPSRSYVFDILISCTDMTLCSLHFATLYFGDDPHRVFTNHFSLLSSHTINHMVYANIR